jgi:hypothetical protein
MAILDPIIHCCQWWSSVINSLSGISESREEFPKGIKNGIEIFLIYITSMQGTLPDLFSRCNLQTP